MIIGPRCRYGLQQRPVEDSRAMSCHIGIEMASQTHVPTRSGPQHMHRYQRSQCISTKVMLLITACEWGRGCQAGSGGFRAGNMQIPFANINFQSPSPYIYNV